MKKHIFFIFLTFCAMQVFSQKTIQINRVDANSLSKVMEDGSKLFTFTISGFTSEDQAIETEQFFKNFRGVEECGFVYDYSTGNCYCTGRFYKHANKEYFSFLFQKAGIQFVKIDNNTLPVEEMKNL